jgi:hypothetical protein
MKKKGWVVLPIIFIFIAFLLGSFVRVLTLEIRNRESGEILFNERVDPGDRVTFGYIHSVEKIPVEGIFVIEEDGFLKLMETRFSSYGAGLPSGQGEEIRKDGWIVVKGGERRASLTFLFSPINQPYIILKEKRLGLGSKLREGALLEIMVTRESYALALWRSLF